ncbi:MAG TPA: cytochrome c oxidase accessory protein CcoG [Phycisphaerales bacterium]|nr:cytochrome c oxidase accessory protein CcoG [Phycisphaerales bacterium]
MTTTAPQERVLATLNADGSRRWLRPRLSRGRFLTARRVVAYFLIALFTLIPFIPVNGHPALLFDIPARRFHVFGATFFPTDTALMALLFLSIFLAIFFVTALFGRVWCGWACPQTVYMEFLYRPIERLFEGEPGRKQRITGATGLRKALKHAVFFACSIYLAHTFLAYFVGVERLWQWVQRSPMEHPGAFLVMAITTALMSFDFAFFREQTCLVACPYGRFQAAMLDRNSLIVTYDRARGEPRGKKKRTPTAAPDVALRVLPGAPPAPSPAAQPRSLGDCIDCTLCVTTCPTGIDIREGLQMECIGCAQCIDACDSVMDKIGRPRGLIRYSSQNIVEGKARSILRPRLALYPAVIAGLLTLFVVLLAGKSTAEAAVLPRQGAPFYLLDTGEVSNQVRLRLVNRAATDASFTISTAEPARIILDTNPVSVPAGESVTVGLTIAFPPALLNDRGAAVLTITISDGAEFTRPIEYRVLGPAGRKLREMKSRSESDRDPVTD